MTQIFTLTRVAWETIQNTLLVPVHAGRDRQGRYQYQRRLLQRNALDSLRVTFPNLYLLKKLGADIV